MKLTWQLFCLVLVWRVVSQVERNHKWPSYECLSGRDDGGVELQRESSERSVSHQTSKEPCVCSWAHMIVAATSLFHLEAKRSYSKVGNRAGSRMAEQKAGTNKGEKRQKNFFDPTYLCSSTSCSTLPICEAMFWSVSLKFEYCICSSNTLSAFFDHE